MRRVGVMLRRFLGGRAASVVSRSSSVGENLFLSSAAAASSYSTLVIADEIARPFFVPAIALGSTGLQPALLNHVRSFSSAPSSDSSKMVLIESEEQFNDLLRKLQDESLPAILYFTAVWCGPCRLLSPILGQLNEKYPHVTTYKIDIDKEEIVGVLGKLNIQAVPTVHFFQNGKKAGEVVGADVQRLKDTMETLYK